MNIFEKTRGGYAMSFKASISKSLRKTGLSQTRYIYLEREVRILFVALLIFALLSFKIPFLFIAYLLIYFIFRYKKYQKKLNKQETISLALSEYNIYIKSQLLDLPYDYTINSNNINEFYILPIDDIKYGLYVKKVYQKDELLFVGEHHKLPEFIDIVNFLHQFFGIVPEGVEDSINLTVKENPNRKREYFKIFDQEIEDIRKKGIITIQDNDYFIDEINQIDWDTGMSAYRFQLDTNTYLFYYPKIVDQLYVIEKEVFDVKELQEFDQTLSDIDKKIDYLFHSFYQTSINKAKYFNGENLVDTSFEQVAYEDLDKKYHLRFTKINGEIKAFYGKIIEEYQIQDILPEIED